MAHTPDGPRPTNANKNRTDAVLKLTASACEGIPQGFDRAGETGHDVTRPGTSTESRYSTNADF